MEAAMHSKDTSGNYHVPGLSKGIRLIELLCDSSLPMGVSEISQKLKLNKNMIFRLLQTLVREGWIIPEGDGPRYRMSLTPFQHTSKPIYRTTLADAATAPLRDLWNETGESVGVAIRDGNRVMYILHSNGTRDISISGRVGTRYLLHCSAPGKMLLANATASEQKKIAGEQLPSMTSKTISSSRSLLAELALTRKRGYALDIEEYAEGAMCYAAPILNQHGSVEAALNISVLKLYYTREKLLTGLGPKIQQTAERISTALGYTPPQAKRS